MFNTLPLKKQIRKIPGVRKFKYELESLYHFSLKKSKLKYFILITRPRSGSTCLMDLISSHPQILTDCHLFLDYTQALPDFQKEQFVYSTKNIKGFKFLTQPYALDLNSENANLAKKALESLIHKGVPIIYLKRENLLNLAISRLRVKLTGKLHLNPREKSAKINCLTLNSENSENFENLIKLLNLAEKQAKFDQEVLRDLPHISLTYEKDLEKKEYHQETLNKVCQALDLDYIPERHIAKTTYVKIATDKSRDELINYEEMAQIIGKTQYKKYLEF